jgi:hypothetical protein
MPDYERIIAAMVVLGIAATGVCAHWEPPPEMFPWANPGALRWAINYRGMNEAHTRALLDARFNLIQGGSFKPDAMELATAAGCHRMMYICSRTIYHERLFPEYPELADAAILTPDGEYKVIYNNPARYAGCYNRPAWLEYIKGRIDELEQRGVDSIFFDNPMTWPCYCPTCKKLFREYSKEHVGREYELGAEGTPKELERWFTLDTARRFFTAVRDHAHNREKPIFIVANNLTYWLIDQGMTDGVFTEAGGQAPFGHNIGQYKVGLAASHGKPTAILTYIPHPVRMVRGVKRYAAPSASERWYGSPIAEEYEAGCAMGLALGGNYLSNFSLTLDRHILEFTDPEDKRILASCGKYAQFAKRWEKLYAGQQPGSGIGILYDLTEGPRMGDVLGTRAATDQLLWHLQSHGIPADVIVNSDLQAGRLTGYQVVIIDGAAMLSPDEMAGLREFVEAGGTAIISAALSIRDRFSPPEQGRSIGEFLPGCEDILAQQIPAQDLQLDGYVPEPSRIKCPQEGTASLTFQGKAGMWRISVDYLDEDDGQSDFELLVNDRSVGSWKADADNNAWLEFASEAMELKPGDRITVHAKHGGGEYARLSALTLRSVPKQGASFRHPLGKGTVIQVAGSVESASEQEHAEVIAALQEAVPVTGKWPETMLVNLLRQPKPGVLGAHIANLDYKYGDSYVLEAINPTPELTLQVQDPRLKVARLISPEAEIQELTLANGEVTIPPVRNYAVVLLAAEAADFEALVR